MDYDEKAREIANRHEGATGVVYSPTPDIVADISAAIKAAVEAERNRRRLRYFTPEGDTAREMAENARTSPLWQEGDLRLVWVSESDLLVCGTDIMAKTTIRERG